MSTKSGPPGGNSRGSNVEVPAATRPSPFTVSATGDGWPDRFAEAVARTVARRAAKKAVRAQLAARRQYGLRARHAGKLRRTGGRR